MINLVPWAMGQIDAHLAGAHGTDITLRWVEQSGAVMDPTTGAEISASAATEKSESVRAMIHYIAPIISDVQRFAELNSGDAMLDLPRDTDDLEGRKQLTFEFDGKVWVQKKISGVLRDYWDVLVGGERLYRTVAVCLKN